MATRVEPPGRPGSRLGNAHKDKLQIAAWGMLGVRLSLDEKLRRNRLWSHSYDEVAGF